MIGQYNGSKEEKWKVASMHRFHRLEQGLSKGPLPHASDWSASGRNCRPFSDELFGCLLGIPPNTTGFEWLKEDNFCHPYWKLPLQSMPFSLKNVGATYQRMMTRIFELQLGKNIEIYIKDMVVKSKLESEHVNDLENIFEILKRHKLWLNTSKCSFGIGLGKFLGYMVTYRGIEVNLD